MRLVCSWALDMESYPVLNPEPVLRGSSATPMSQSPCLDAKPPHPQGRAMWVEITVGKGLCWAGGIWHWAIEPLWRTAWVCTQTCRVTRGREGMLDYTSWNALEGITSREQYERDQWLPMLSPYVSACPWQSIHPMGGDWCTQHKSTLA